MKILFTASVLQRDQLLDEYKRIINALQKSGNDVVKSHILDIELKDIYSQTIEESHEYFNNLRSWILESDVIVAEASWPSTINIGFEIAYALQKNKSVIVLYKGDRKSTFFRALTSDKLIYESYTNENLESVVSDCLDFIDKKSDIRFNFYLPSNQIDYLDSVGESKNLSRSAILREIISNDIKRTSEK